MLSPSTKKALTTTEGAEIEPTLETIKLFLESGKVIQVPVRLCQQAQEYHAKGKWLFRCKRAALRLVPPVKHRASLVDTFHDELGLWGIEATTCFVEARL